VNKIASILDFAKPGLSTSIWEISTGLLKDSVKKQILEKLYRVLRESDYKNYDKWIDKIRIVGSLTTYLYNSFSDLDVHAIVNVDKLAKEYTSEETLEKFAEDLKLIQKKLNEEEMQFIEGSTHPIEYYFEIPGIQETFIEKGGEYNVLEDKWEIEPYIVSFDYDVKQAYKELLPEVEDIIHEFDMQIGDIKRDIIDVKFIEETVEKFSFPQKLYFKDKLKTKISNIEAEIRKLIQMGNKLHNERKDEWRKGDIGIGELTFKFLQRYSYAYMYKKLEAMLKEEHLTVEDLPLIEKILKGEKVKTEKIKDITETACLILQLLDRYPIIENENRLCKAYNLLKNNIYNEETKYNLFSGFNKIDHDIAIKPLLYLINRNENQQAAKLLGQFIMNFRKKQGKEEVFSVSVHRLPKSMQQYYGSGEILVKIIKQLDDGKVDVETLTEDIYSGERFVVDKKYLRKF